MGTPIQWPSLSVEFTGLKHYCENLPGSFTVGRRYTFNLKTADSLNIAARSPCTFSFLFFFYFGLGGDPKLTFVKGYNDDIDEDDVRDYFWRVITPVLRMSFRNDLGTS